MSARGPVAVVTGASSGIGAAVSRLLAAAGYELVIGARREKRLRELAAEIGARPLRLDVTDAASVTAFAAAIEHCEVLVNNAGGALGIDPIEQADDERWLRMYETNVIGTVRMVRALLPQLVASGRGHIVAITSTSAFETYGGSSGYGAAKHAQRALLRTLRLELLGRPVRITEVAPGMVDTEFSLVRYGGDEAAARAVYEGFTPLGGEDVAECVRWAISCPPHVNVDEIVVRPRDQARSRVISRRTCS